MRKAPLRMGRRFASNRLHKRHRSAQLAASPRVPETCPGLAARSVLNHFIMDFFHSFHLLSGSRWPAPGDAAVLFVAGKGRLAAGYVLARL
jgi:hypothetical protein